MIVTGTTAFLSILGIAVIGQIGNTILVEVGKGSLASFLNIVAYVAASVIGIKFFLDGLRTVGAIFQIYF